jgi:hypothetical protein
MCFCPNQPCCAERRLIFAPHGALFAGTSRTVRTVRPNGPNDLKQEFMNMSINHVQDLIERLRKEVLGTPAWIEDKQVFEYPAQAVGTVASLSLVPAAQGLACLNQLSYAISSGINGNN